MAAGAVMIAAALSVSACTEGSDAAGDEIPINPVSAFTDDQRFTYGEPVISESGTGSGNWDLPVLTRGQTVAVTASCLGGEEVRISTDQGLLEVRTGCDNPAGAFAHQEIDAVPADERISVDVGAENAYWLNVFVVEPTEPALSEPATAQQEMLQEWSLRTVEPQGEEIARLVEAVGPGTLTYEVEAEPGLYRWAGSCRNGSSVLFTVQGGGLEPGGSVQCSGESGGGTVHAMMELTEPATLEMTATVDVDAGQTTDVTLVLARAVGQ